MEVSAQLANATVGRASRLDTFRVLKPSWLQDYKACAASMLVTFARPRESANMDADKHQLTPGSKCLLHYFYRLATTGQCRLLVKLLRLV